MASPSKKAFLLRYDPALHDALQRWADDEARSLNAHIEYLLKESLRRAGRKPAKKGRTPKPSPDTPENDDAP